MSFCRFRVNFVEFIRLDRSAGYPLPNVRLCVEEREQEVHTSDVPNTGMWISLERAQDLVLACPRMT